MTTVVGDGRTTPLRCHSSHKRVAWKRNILISLKTAPADRMSVSVNMNQICKSRFCIESGMDERTFVYSLFINIFIIGSYTIRFLI